MTNVSKILVSVIAVLVIAFTGILLYAYWPAITGTINNNKYYTSEEVQNAYDQGYADGNKSETELTAQVEYYRTLVDDYYIQVELLNAEIQTLSYDNNEKTANIEKLTSQKNELLANVENLTSINVSNEELIKNQKAEIESMQKEIAILSKSNENKDEEIGILNNQIINLQSLVSQLQTTNSLNVETISNLNAQIVSLNSQISDLTLQVQNNSGNVTSLNNKIAELEKSIAYYEQYIANLESGSQVVATFEFNGSVYNIQVVNQNDIVSVTTPTSTDYVIFNYWMVDGVQVDLSTYPITTNTKFVANVTYKYDVVYKVDNNIYNKQIVIQNGIANIPANPTLEGYSFDGWTNNGVDIVDPSTIEITQNTVFVAKFTKLHTVSYMYENEVIASEQVRNGEFAQGKVVEDTIYKKFNGWLLNGSRVDLTTYQVTGAITLIADLTYSYDVKFIVDNEIYDNQVIEENGIATLPENPTKEGYIFKGWMLDDIVYADISKIIITEETIFQAYFTEPYAMLVTGSTFNTRVGTAVTDVIFDYYTDKENKTYVVDGVNVIDGVEAVDLTATTSEGATAELYKVGDIAFVLSTDKIYLNSSANKTFYNCSKLTNIVYNNFDTSKVKNMSYFFYYCSSLTNIDLSKYDTQSVTSMYYMFRNCTALTSLNLSYLDTSNVYDMSYMFYNCTGLSTLDLKTFNTQNVTSMSGMFYGCTALTNIDFSGFKTEKVQTMKEMFYNCSALTNINIKHFVTTSLTSMYRMFYGCSGLTSLDITNFETPNLTTLEYAFFNCTALTSLDLSSLDTSKVTTMFYMFGNCSNLVSIDLSSFRTSNVNNMFRMFQGCSSLTSLDLTKFDTSKITSIGYMFEKCSSLTTLDLSSFSTASVKSSQHCFQDCTNLTTIYVGNGWDIDSEKIPLNADGMSMFRNCKNLVSQTSGVSYDAGNTGVGMANWETGYLTYKAA